MKFVANFTPGPSQLFFTVQDHIRNALKDNIPSISHRSTIFENIFEETTTNLRKLLNIPSSHHIFFTGSATEIWELILTNLVESRSHHLVNGAFSNRFYETATQLQKQPSASIQEYSRGVDNNLEIPDDAEFLAVTHNETSTGVSIPLSRIHSWRDQFPDKIIAVDAVSSLPYPDFDYTKIDTLFFSVQKGFGLPAGLGVWIANDRCVSKAQALQDKGLNIGSFHSLLSLTSFAKKNQTPETPNVLAIYLLGKVIQDLLNRSITTIRRETDYKAAILYQTLNQHPLLTPFVPEKEFQSRTVVVSHAGEHTARIKQALLDKGIYPGSGYGSFKETTLRFANFPAHSKEQVELLVDTLMDIK